MKKLANISKKSESPPEIILCFFLISPKFSNSKALIKDRNKCRDIFKIGYHQQFLLAPESKKIPKNKVHFEKEEVHPVLTKKFDNMITEDWYWGKLSLETVKNLLKNENDGNFLVIRSLLGFVLCVRNLGKVGIFDIKQDQFKYWLTESAIFDSIPSLINYYKNFSLKYIKKEIDCALNDPVSYEKIETLKDGNGGEIVSLLKEKNDAYKEALKMNSNAKQVVQERSTSARCEMETLRLFEEHQETCNYIKKQSLNDSNSIVHVDNFLKKLSNAINRVNKDIKKLDEETGEETRRMNESSGLLHKLSKQIPSLKISNKHSKQPVRASRAGDIELAGYFGEMPSTGAEYLLNLEPVGTYLIRLSTKKNLFVLSVRHKARVVHYYILQEKNNYYIVTIGPRFPSIKDLLAYYHKNIIKTKSDPTGVILMKPFHTE